MINKEDDGWVDDLMYEGGRDNWIAREITWIKCESSKRVNIKPKGISALF